MKTILYLTVLFVFASAFPFGGNINGITDYDQNSGTQVLLIILMKSICEPSTR